MKKINYWLIIFIFTALYSLVLVCRDLRKTENMSSLRRREYAAYDREIKKNAYLCNRTLELNRDDKIELAGRSRLGLIKPGETPYKIINSGK